jgi:pyruvate dehydrogenase E1 component
VKHKGQPTVILAKTVKGYGMGEAGEGKNIVHQTKKLDDEAVRAFRDRFNMPIPTTSWPRSRSTSRPTTRRRCATCTSAASRAGRLPAAAPPQGRRALDVPPLLQARAEAHRRGPRDQHHHGLRALPDHLLRDKALGPRVVPIVADEARTFGMEGLFRQIGIYNRRARSTPRSMPTS